VATCSFNYSSDGSELTSYCIFWFVVELEKCYALVVVSLEDIYIFFILVDAKIELISKVEVVHISNSDDLSIQNYRYLKKGYMSIGVVVGIVA